MNGWHREKDWWRLTLEKLHRAESEAGARSYVNIREAFNYVTECRGTLRYAVKARQIPSENEKASIEQRVASLENMLALMHEAVVQARIKFGEQQLLR